MAEMVVELRRLLTAFSDRALFGLSWEELVAGTDACFRARALLDGLIVAHVREVDARGLARAQGASSTKAWLVERQRVAAGFAQRLVRLAKSLDRDAAMHPDLWLDPDPAPDPALAAAPASDPDPAANPASHPDPASNPAFDPAPDLDPASNHACGPDPAAGSGADTDPDLGADQDPGEDLFRLPPGIRSARDALEVGLINLEQADEIGSCVKDLPAEYRAEAETLLVGDAQQLGPLLLRQLGQVILRRVAPERADELEGEALRRHEKRAYRDRGLHLSRTSNGGVRVTGTFDAADAAVISAAIEAHCTPTPTVATTTAPTPNAGRTPSPTSASSPWTGRNSPTTVVAAPRSS